MPKAKDIVKYSNSKNGRRKVTMKKVKKHGRNGNLSMKITKNEPA